MADLPDDTSERTEGPTPNGGASAVAYFRDRDGRPCRKADAAAMEVIELDASGTAIFRTYLQIPSKPDVPI